MSNLDEQGLIDLYQREYATVYRVCYSHLKDSFAIEDAVQETFLRAWTKAPVFTSESHEKGWLVRTASNICKDILKSAWRKKTTVGDTFKQIDTQATDTTLETVLSLPNKYKSVVYLYYYEGYSAAEIAEGLGMPASTVRNRLSQARKLIRTRLGGDFDEE